MKFSIILLLGICFFSLTVRADHITGGEIYYRLSGSEGNIFYYHITLKIFMRCHSGREFNDPLWISVFNKHDNSRVTDIRMRLGKTENITQTEFSLCITNPPEVCYLAGYYEVDVPLPASPYGYLVAAQIVYRVESLKNLTPNYADVGSTFTAEIPGTNTINDGPNNSSAKFIGDDRVVVCSNNSFTYNFTASDDDGDKLKYSFADAYQGGAGGFGNINIVPTGPPYEPVPYSRSFSGLNPLGNAVKIDRETGLISGIAPGEGNYVLTVQVDEERGGKIIASQRKDIQIKVSNCTIAAASIPPAYNLCHDSRSIEVFNLSSSPLIKTMNWDFINDAGDIIFSSHDQSVSYTFPAEGNYKIKLSINRGDLCSDSATSVVRVFPGFITDFKYSGQCFGNPTQFEDMSTTVSGRINKWSWNFVDGNIDSTRNDKAPVFTYISAGQKEVTMIVSNSVGCEDTVTKTFEISDKPPIHLAFTDTLICSPDEVKLQGTAPGEYIWSPQINITGENTASPTVRPVSTTKYYADLFQNGCRNRDSVLVNVVDHVSLQAMNDSVICAGDPVQFHIKSDGLRFQWSPAAALSDAQSKNPSANILASGVYTVTANIGSCSASDDVLISTVPYPVVNAGPDLSMCYNTSARLSGVAEGISYRWSPSETLSDPNSLTPQARPRSTTSYTLAVYDNKGCPKPGLDTMVLTVSPKINASAGNDTAIIKGESLTLHASGGVRYLWSPADAISGHSSTSATPLVQYSSSSTGIRYKVLVYDQNGCTDSAFMTLKIFNTPPSIFVPNAFTPNGDGRNDKLTFIAAGIKTIGYFRVYNRYGQLVFNSSDNRTGWDGSVGGAIQPSGSFIWMVSAIDFHGIPYVRKGSVVLIR